MLKTLRLSFSLRNTYRVNSILYLLKQVPLLKKILPATLYRVRGLKIFANILSLLWEIVSIFLGKFLYFITMVCGVGLIYQRVAPSAAFLHVLFFLTLIGGYMNTSLFNPTWDKYYAMILMRMNARDYTIVNYGYAILKVVVGFLPFTIWFGLNREVPLWLCILLPFCIAGLKMMIAAYSLWKYEKDGLVYNENKIRKFLWLFSGIMLALAYIPPAVGFVLPTTVAAALFLVWLPLGVVSAVKIIRFAHYRAINQHLLSQMTYQMDTMKQAVKRSSEKSISADLTITSNRKGFEYLNELFIKRHKKILWQATKRVAVICALVVCAGLVTLYIAPQFKQNVNQMILNWLPYFVFIMYAINRGTGFTQALFMNCDHSLLSYSFFKQPKFVLKLFQIRLREIMKINAVPAVVIGLGLCLLLYASGGTSDPLNYVVLFVSILCMSLFFSIHYLTIYYLLQPYTAGIEMKNPTYQIVMFATYFVCLQMLKVKMPLLVFGISCIAFCILYSIVASVLVYLLAPKTFRFRT